MTRRVHPGAWWGWALGLAAAASRTTDPVVLALLLGVATFVVTAQRADDGLRAFGFFARLAVVVVMIRLAFEAVFGDPLPGHVLVRLPSVPLPSVLAGVRIGGSITAEAMLTALYGGLQLAALLVCVGAANTVASPRRLLRCLPGALYELGVAITVAMSFAPQLARAVTRVRRARRLRGLSSSGLRGWGGVALPVLQDALESSLELAAAMDARGFGRRGAVSRRRRRATSAAVLTGLLAVAAASYGLLATGSPAAIGVPLLATGAAVASAAVVLGGRGVARTRYRPDAWGGREWVIAVSGLAALAGVVAAGRFEPGSLHTGTYPIGTPELPWPALAGLAVALLPAVLGPRVPRALRPPRHPGPAVSRERADSELAGAAG
jgi:energy-coupling factor transport system permease protein